LKAETSIEDSDEGPNAGADDDADTEPEETSFLVAFGLVYLIENMAFSFLWFRLVCLGCG